MEKRTLNRSFLLTVWQEPSQNAEHPPLWRFGLEDVHGRERKRIFSTIEELMLVVSIEVEGKTTAPKCQ